MVPEPELLTIATVAERLEVSKRTVYRLIADGALDVVSVRHRWRVPDWSFRAYLARIGAADAAEGGS